MYFCTFHDNDRVSYMMMNYDTNSFNIYPESKM